MKVNVHSAPGPMLGYIFQLERALYWLCKTGQSGVVAIETDDDLVVKLRDDRNIGKYFEQDKSATLSNRNPFSNKSKELWKTLSIWSTAITHKTIDLERDYLLLVTNKKVGECMIHGILRTKKDEAEFAKKIDAFIEQAEKSESEEVADFAKTVAELDAAEKVKLFKRIELLDLDYKHDRGGTKNEIRDELHVNEHTMFNAIYNSLLGWLTDHIIDRWLSGEQALIKGSDLNTYYSELVVKYHSKPFIEKAKEVLPVEDAHRSVHMRDNFVRQLGWIDLEEKMVIKAIDDFLRARWERTRYAVEGNIPCQQDFDKMYADLIERWENMYQPLTKNCTKDEEKKSRGYKLYFLVTEYKSKLANYETEEYYTTKGAYHLLANQFKLGWHLDWEVLKDKDDD